MRLTNSACSFGALAPSALAAIKVTLNGPGPPYTCVGFCCVETGDPSPKFHDQDVGLPVDVSANWTSWPTTGFGGDIVKLAVGAAALEKRPNARTEKANADNNLKKPPKNVMPPSLLSNDRETNRHSARMRI
jgi:hypothetical protein